MNYLDYYLEVQTLDDVKNITYSNDSSLAIITDFLAHKINLLNMSETEGKGQKEITFFKNAISQNPHIQIPKVNASSVYISGPMSKHPYANYHSFYLAEAILVLSGMSQSNIINPATIPHVANSGWIDFMINDLEGMFLKTDMLILLPGWETSLGARVEKIVAENIQNFKRLLSSNLSEDEVKGSYQQQNVKGQDEQIFNSPEFQSILKNISQQAEVSFDYLTEIFQTSKIFNALRNSSNSYSIKELKNILDIKACEKAIADQIQSLNLWKEDRSIIARYINKARFQII